MRKNTDYFVFVLVSVILFVLSGLKVVEELSMLDVDCTLVITRIKEITPLQILFSVKLHWLQLSPENTVL